jgi:hypothetical protein
VGWFMSFYGELFGETLIVGGVAGVVSEDYIVVLFFNTRFSWHSTLGRQHTLILPSLTFLHLFSLHLHINFFLPEICKTVNSKSFKLVFLLGGLEALLSVEGVGQVDGVLDEVNFVLAW